MLYNISSHFWSEMNKYRFLNKTKKSKDYTCSITLGFTKKFEDCIFSIEVALFKVK